MNSETMLLNEAIVKTNEKLVAVISKINKGEIRDSATMINDILTNIGEIFVLLESLYGTNNNIIHDINTSVEQVIVAYEKNDCVLIRLNVEKFKNLILGIDI